MIPPWPALVEIALFMLVFRPASMFRSYDVRALNGPQRCQASGFRRWDLHFQFLPVFSPTGWIQPRVMAISVPCSWWAALVGAYFAERIEVAPQAARLL